MPARSCRAWEFIPSRRSGSEQTGGSLQEEEKWLAVGRKGKAVAMPNSAEKKKKRPSKIKRLWNSMREQAQRLAHIVCCTPALAAATAVTEADELEGYEEEMEEEMEEEEEEEEQPAPAVEARAVTRATASAGARPTASNAQDKKAAAAQKKKAAPRPTMATRSMQKGGAAAAATSIRRQATSAQPMEEGEHESQWEEEAQEEARDPIDMSLEEIIERSRAKQPQAQAAAANYNPGHPKHPKRKQQRLTKKASKQSIEAEADAKQAAAEKAAETAKRLAAEALAARAAVVVATRPNDNRPIGRGERANFSGQRRSDGKDDRRSNPNSDRSMTNQRYGPRNRTPPRRNRTPPRRERTPPRYVRRDDEPRYGDRNSGSRGHSRGHGREFSRDQGREYGRDGRESSYRRTDNYDAIARPQPTNEQRDTTTQILMTRVDQFIQRTLDGAIQATTAAAAQPTQVPTQAQPAPARQAPATSYRTPASDPKWGRGLYGQRDVNARRYGREGSLPVMHNHRSPIECAECSGRHLHNVSKRPTEDQTARFK